MKYIRYTLVGLVIGGALGAKLGSYLSTLLEWPPSYDAIQTGFVYGAFIATILTTFGLSIYAWVNHQKNAARQQYQDLKDAKLTPNFH